MARLVGSIEATFPARPADSERTTVADDVGAAVGDRSQFRRAERALQERSFRGRECTRGFSTIYQLCNYRSATNIRSSTQPFPS